jgi:DNA uptake protein ComE-like DNA-binding protein
MRSFGIVALSALVALPVASASAQLGRQQGLVEPNVAADTTLAKLPGLNAAAIEALKSANPLLSIVTVDSILASKGLTKAQRTALYGKMFVHVDVNRGSDAEFSLIPGLDAPKVAAIKAGRPWKTFEQFQTSFGKATSAAEATRVEQYLFIPIELNTFTPAIMDTFASIGVGTARWKREFNEYRPWTSMAQFEREIGKYLRGNPSELKRLERYVIIEGK